MEAALNNSWLNLHELLCYLKCMDWIYILVIDF